MREGSKKNGIHREMPILVRNRYWGPLCFVNTGGDNRDSSDWPGDKRWQ